MTTATEKERKRKEIEDAITAAGNIQDEQEKQRELERLYNELARL